MELPEEFVEALAERGWVNSNYTQGHYTFYEECDAYEEEYIVHIVGTEYGPGVPDDVSDEDRWTLSVSNAQSGMRVDNYNVTQDRTLSDWQQFIRDLDRWGKCPAQPA